MRLEQLWSAKSQTKMLLGKFWICLPIQTLKVVKYQLSRGALSYLPARFCAQIISKQTFASISDSNALAISKEKSWSEQQLEIQMPFTSGRRCAAVLSPIPIL